MTARGLTLGLDATQESAGAATDRAPEDDEGRRAWAAAMGAAAPIAPGRAPLALEGPEPTPVSWRPTDVSLTDLAAALGQGASPAEPADGARTPRAVVSRIETAVETSALGRVRFVVDRSNAGMSIVVEVSSRAAADAVEKDRRLLLSTLRASGITVLSFRVLLRAGDGPNLAGERDVPHAARSRQATRYRSSDEPDDDPSGRVEVVG
jgi:hypothetical protein